MSVTETGEDKEGLSTLAVARRARRQRQRAPLMTARAVARAVARRL